MRIRTITCTLAAAGAVAAVAAGPSLAGQDSSQPARAAKTTCRCATFSSVDEQHSGCVSSAKACASASSSASQSHSAF